MYDLHVPPPLISRRSLLAAAVLPPTLQQATRLLEGAVAAGTLRAAVLRVEQGSTVYEKAFGSAKPDTLFLLASITKPMTACGLMKLVDEGKLGYEDPVHRYLDSFHEGGRDKITLRHLLTHSSGLPDMPPDNTELRKRHASLRDFAASAKRAPLLFAPGTRVSYQSMGILLAAQIAEKITGQPFQEYLSQALFQPLSMSRSALGLGRFRIEDTALSQGAAEVELPGQDANDWGWNSAYWRNLGSPWGGAHSTAADVAKLVRYFLKPADGPLRKATAMRMITNQNQGLNQPYGIGWNVYEGVRFGHSGSVGTLAWGDPATGKIFVLLTTLPSRLSMKTLITPVSDLVRA